MATTATTTTATRNARKKSGPNIIKSELLFEHTNASNTNASTRLTAELIEVDNPSNSLAPGEHSYIEIRNWYWHNTAGTWMPAKGIWMRIDNNVEVEAIVKLCTAIIRRLGQ